MEIQMSARIWNGWDMFGGPMDKSTKESFSSRDKGKETRRIRLKVAVMKDLDKVQKRTQLDITYERERRRSIIL